MALPAITITPLPRITHPGRDSAIEHDSTSYIHKRRKTPTAAGIAVWAFCVLVFVAAMIGLLNTTQSIIGRYLFVLRESRFFVAVPNFQRWVIHHVHNIFLKVKGSAQRMKENINMTIASIWAGITRRKVEKDPGKNQRQEAHAA